MRTYRLNSYFLARVLQHAREHWRLLSVLQSTGLSTSGWEMDVSDIVLDACGIPQDNTPDNDELPLSDRFCRDGYFDQYSELETLAECEQFVTRLHATSMRRASDDSPLRWEPEHPGVTLAQLAELQTKWDLIIEKLEAAGIELRGLSFDALSLIFEHFNLDAAQRDRFLGLYKAAVLRGGIHDAGLFIKTLTEQSPAPPTWVHHTPVN